MNRKIVLITTLLIFVSCKKTYDSETDFMNCIYSKNGETDTIIKNALFEHEVYLKSKGLIKGNNGKDYKKLIEDIADKTITIDEIGKTMAVDMSALDIDVIGCGKKYASQSLKARKLRALFSDILNKENNLSEIFASYNTIVDEEDFEQSFYKVCTFVIIDYYLLEFNK